MSQAPTSSSDAPMPRHVAIIMDGNGRWAQKRRRPRVIGHRAGARAVNRTIDFCLDHGVAALTLFAFSSENWGRPTDEVDA
ncbi:di-trans,poly-cis-decaprenylcistransferase, partial [Mycobacterium tuberculosis]